MPKTVLLADDSLTIQRVVTLTFANEDVTITSVSDGDQAVESISRKKPDLVLADIAMPGRSGYQVAEFVRSKPELSELPVLLLAGAFDHIDEAHVRTVGADGVLTKPFEPKALIGQVKQLLATGRPEPVLHAEPEVRQPIAAIAAVSESAAEATKIPAMPPMPVSIESAFSAFAKPVATPEPVVVPEVVTIPEPVPAPVADAPADVVEPAAAAALAEAAAPTITGPGIDLAAAATAVRALVPPPAPVAPIESAPVEPAAAEATSLEAALPNLTVVEPVVVDATPVAAIVEAPAAPTLVDAVVEPAVIEPRVAEPVAVDTEPVAPAPVDARADAPSPSAPAAQPTVEPPVVAPPVFTPSIPRTPSPDTYFEQIDQAFAALAKAPRPSLNLVPKPSTPAPVVEESRDEVVAAVVEPKLASFTAALRAAEAPARTIPLSDAFNALLDAERAGVIDTTVRLSGVPAFSPVDVDALATQVMHRVLEQMTDRVVRETVTEIVSNTAERLVREEIEQVKRNIT
ncbi:MAG: response regulator [Vicinamibacterales bacterium]